MKRNLTKSIIVITLLALSFGVASCNTNQVSSKEDSSYINNSGSTIQEIYNKNVSLRYYYEQSPVQGSSILGIAHLYYEGDKLGRGFQDVIEPRVLVGGDVFHFSFTGQIADPIMSIPGDLSIMGEVIDYEYIKTTLRKVEPESGSLIDALNNYEIKDPYVIINQQGSYKSLEDFDGDKVYITFDYKAMYMKDYDENDSAEPVRPIVAAIYSFDPRNS